MNTDRIVSMLNPAVPRRFLFGIAGILWTTAGLLLCLRGVMWIEPFPFLTQTLLALMGVGIAGVAYYFMFKKIVQQNIDRIRSLPARACVFAFVAWRGYLMIGMMVALGVLLRNTAIPKHYLSIPYIAMGGVLLFGSLKFYREFWGAASSDESAA